MTLEEIENQWKEDWPYQAPVYINWLISRIEELEDGIKRHQDIIGMSESVADVQLYKLIKNLPPL